MTKELRIVYTDDEDSLRDLFKNFIPRAFPGYKVVVETGSSGLDLVKIVKSIHGIVHGIITDENMPGMRGTEALLELRATEKYREIPAMVSSGGADQSLTDNLPKLLGVGFLPKPYNIEEFTKGVHAHFSKYIPHA